MTLDTSDIGNAKLFASMHKADIRFFAARKTWLVWRGNRWVDDPDGEIMRRAFATADRLQQMAWAIEPDGDDEDAIEGAKKRRGTAVAWARLSRSSYHLEQMIKLARNAPGITITPDELDANPWLLNCPNGVLDLRTGELEAPTPGLLQTKLTAIAYAPEAKSERWLRFVAELTGGDTDLASYLQRALGYALYGAWAEKAFWFCYGPPDGGKSTLLAIVGSILGDYHVSADASTWMQGRGAGNRGDITRLRGARLVTTSEVRAGARFDEEVVKKVTGGDTLTYAAKYEHDISFKPTFALWLAANDRPAISSGDDGMWRRVQCIPCIHSVPRERQNPRLVHELTSGAEAQGVLAWLVEGCRMWQREGLGSCKAIDSENDAYRAEMNPLAEFAHEKITITGNDSDLMSVADMREAYAEWCSERREKFPLKAKSFNRALRALGAAGADTDTKVTVGKSQVTAWRRVRRTWR